MFKFLDRFNNNNSYREIAETTRSNMFTAVFGVQKYEKPVVCNILNDFVMVVTSDYVEAQQTVRTLNALGGKYRYLPHNEDVLMFRNSVDCQHRNSILYDMYCGRLNGIVVCIESLMQYYPQRNYIVDGTIQLDKGQDFAYEQLLSRLIAIGYTRVDALQGNGQVVVRGDIVELMCCDNRYRIDFWGDTVDNIVAIDKDMTSSVNIDSLTIVPTTATSMATESVLTAIIRNNTHKIGADAHTRLADIISKIEQQVGGGVYSNSWLVPFLDKSTLLEYLPPNTTIIWDEPKLILGRSNFLYNEQDTRVANLLEGGEILPAHSKTLVDRLKLYSAYNGIRQLSLQTLPYGGTFFQPTKIIKLSTSAVSYYGSAVEKLKTDISHWLQFGYEVVILAGDIDSCNAVQRQLSDVGTYVVVQEQLTAGSADGIVLPLPVEHGYISHSNKVAIIGTRELGRSTAKVATVNKKSTFLSVNKGEYVVHQHHGIGLFEGVERLENNGDFKDYFVVLYKGGDRLFVPAENSNSLSRYSGGDNPHLSRLGGGDFEKLKSKVKASIKEMSINLIQLYASRNKPRGFVYEIDPYLIEQFAQGFEYTETADQSKSIEEVMGDLTQDKIMDRVLVGDVGFGKTEVAMRAAFAVVSNGYQCAVLAPTTILSEQHYQSFVDRFAPFNIRVACINRFRTKQQQKAIIEATQRGEVDILIGTHRLLSDDVKFNKLSLLILDEEQRFGVEHKEKVKVLKTNIDVLTLSATPIPRTLHMALSGIRDISTLTTPPPARQAVDTYVVESNISLIRDIILRELNRGGQVFLLYNSVNSIDTFAQSIKQHIPEAKIIVAHGQMQERALEDAVINFAEGKSNVLICTTIIENGINIINANTLIVYDADRLGLSQLYQLRGRVGRGDKLAYAYFMYNQDKVLSSDAYKRLASITQYSQLGSGFKIAMQDLEIRGAGNILGREQHGHMVKVGYDMYAKLLAEAVGEATGQPVKQRVDTSIDFDIEAFAPNDYIVSSDERMQVYQNIASCVTIQQLQSLQSQLEEVYGVIPQAMANLLTIARLKITASNSGVSRVYIKNNSVQLTFNSRDDMFRQCVVDAVVSSNGQWSFATSGYCVTNATLQFVQRDRIIASTLEFLSTIAL